MWQRLFRRRKDDEPKFEPYVPRNGFNFDEDVPSAVLRKLQQCKLAMTDDNKREVRRLQHQLGRAGYEVPTTPSECDAIRARIEAR
jgi:hypothetical protein